jgi:hypothetical protein
MGVLVFATTTIKDTGISTINLSATGNITSDWFLGKLNWSDVQNAPTSNWLITYNSTYQTWAYNQTGIYGYNQSTATYNMYNTPWTATYNSTYHLWAYNMTSASTGTYNSTYDTKADYLFNGNNFSGNGSFTTSSKITTQNISIGLGSVINPSLNFISDTGTGFYRYAESAIGISSDTSLRMLINNIVTIYGDLSLDDNDLTHVDKLCNASLDCFTLSEMNRTTISTSTYNSTYATWLPNYTAFNQFWYNMTTTFYNSTYQTWAYNMTTPAISYANANFYNKSANINTGTYNTTTYQVNATSYIINEISGACSLTKLHSICANATGTYMVG